MKLLIALLVIVGTIFILQSPIFPINLPVSIFSTPTPTTAPTSTPTIGEIFGIPDFYYNMPGVIPEDVDPRVWFSQRQWSLEYAENEFDCSNMAAIVEFTLENSGYNAKFALGDALGGKHAWLEVEIDGEWYVFEPTKMIFIGHVSSSKAKLYQPEYILDDIYELAELYYPLLIEKFKREFVWWD